MTDSPGEQRAPEWVDIPPTGGTWSEFVQFAHSYNASTRLVRSPEWLGRSVYLPVWEVWQESGRIPDEFGEDLLRACLFYMARADRSAGEVDFGSPEEEGLYRALIAELHRRAGGRVRWAGESPSQLAERLERDAAAATATPRGPAGSSSSDGAGTAASAPHERLAALVTSVIALAEQQDEPLGGLLDVPTVPPSSVAVWAQVRREIATDARSGELDALEMLDNAVGYLAGALIELAAERGETAQDLWRTFATQDTGRREAPPGG